MENDKFYYFAYGSNLLSERIRINNPSAKFKSTGILRKHQLDFNNKSKVSNITPTHPHVSQIASLKTMDNAKAEQKLSNILLQKQKFPSMLQFHVKQQMLFTAFRAKNVICSILARPKGKQNSEYLNIVAQSIMPKWTNLLLNTLTFWVIGFLTFLSQSQKNVLRNAQNI